jgi:clan AA aspartic protease
MSVGIVYADVELLNPRDRTLPPIKVSALADTGSMNMCISEELTERLKLETLYEQEVILADGTRRKCRYVGPLQVRISDTRQTFVGAYVMGDAVILGAIPMEDLDVIVDPRELRLIPNPISNRRV